MKFHETVFTFTMHNVHWYFYSIYLILLFNVLVNITKSISWHNSGSPLTILKNTTIHKTCICHFRETFKTSVGLTVKVKCLPVWSSTHSAALHLMTEEVRAKCQSLVMWKVEKEKSNPFAWMKWPPQTSEQHTQRPRDSKKKSHLFLGLKYHG